MFRRRKPNFKTVVSRNMCISRRRVYIGTKNPVPITSNQAGAFLAQDNVDKIQYSRGVFECDGFALALAGHAKTWFAKEYNINPAFGIVWTDKTRDEDAHALNFYVGLKYRIAYIEPQTDLQISPDGRNIFVLI